MEEVQADAVFAAALAAVAGALEESVSDAASFGGFDLDDDEVGWSSRVRGVRADKAEIEVSGDSFWLPTTDKCDSAISDCYGGSK